MPSPSSSLSTSSATSDIPHGELAVASPPAPRPTSPALAAHSQSHSNEQPHGTMDANESKQAAVVHQLRMALDQREDAARIRADSNSPETQETLEHGMREVQGALAPETQQSAELAHGSSG